jgi:hypothetical protein
MQSQAFQQRHDEFIQQRLEQILRQRQEVKRYWYPKCVDPQFVPAARAFHMRPADWVVGFVHNGDARCYPCWIMDNYHIVNDTVGGDHFAVMHCEICCSSAAYYTYVDGLRLTFGTYGLVHGAMAGYDIETSTLWSHDVGYGLEGPHAGKALKLAQTFQSTYAEWLELYPKTLVLTYPALGQHPDARHGHGSWHNFGDPGLVRVAAKTVAAPFDPKFPENEMMISLIDGKPAVFPLRDFQAAGGLHHFNHEGQDLVAFGKDLESSLAGVFQARLDGHTLRFKKSSGRFVDSDTRSVWRVDGLCVRGKRKGRRLTPFPTVLHKWHSINLLMPSAEVLTVEGVRVSTRREYPFLRHLSAGGYAVEVRADLFRLELPNFAEYGADVRINGDPFRLYAFATPLQAQEYAFAARASLVRGRFVLRSTPDLFKDPLHAEEKKEDEIEWSRLLRDERFLAALGSFPAPAANGTVSLKEVFEGLTSIGYEVVLKNPCARDVLPVHCEGGAEVLINGDPFHVYRFSSRRSAQAYEQDPMGCLKVGAFVFRSDPPNYYRLPWPVSTIRNADDVISWSKLVKDEKFKNDLTEIIGKGAGRAVGSAREKARIP